MVGANIYAQALPSFVLACSYANGQPWYRVASDGKDIYFASILNDLNLNAAKKSSAIVTMDREIRWSISEGSELSGTGEKVILYRDTLNLVIGAYIYRCDKIDDTQIFGELKKRFDATRARALDEKKNYDNRPNKL